MPFLLPPHQSFAYTGPWLLFIEHAYSWVRTDTGITWWTVHHHHHKTFSTSIFGEYAKIPFVTAGSNASRILARRIYPGYFVLLGKPLPLCQQLPVECRISILNVRLHEWNPGLARVGVLPWLQQSQDLTTSFWDSSSLFRPMWQLEKFILDLQSKLEACYSELSFALPR